MAVTFANAQGYNRTGDTLCNNAFSFCAWVYRTGTNTTGSHVFSADENGSPTDYIAIDHAIGSNTQFTLFDNVTYAAVTTPTAALNEWRFVACSQPASADGTIYVGDLAGNWGSASGGTRPMSNATPVVRISGDAAGGGYNFLGRMAGVRWWSTTLTEAELRNEMGSLRPKRIANLHSWLPFVGGPSGVDYSGNGNTWSVISTPTGGDGPPIGWGASPHCLQTGSLVVQRNPVPMGFVVG